MRVAVRTVALLVVLLLPSGCIVLLPGAIVGAGAGAYIARDIRVKEDAAVQVKFDAPRDVALLGTRARDTTLLAGTSVLLGRVRRIRDDTLWLAVSEAHTANGARSRYDRRRAPEVVVVVQPGVRVYALGSQLGSAMVGGALGLGVSIGVLIVFCMLNPCFD